MTNIAAKTISLKLLIFVGLASFACSLIFFAPASLIAPALQASGANIQYREVTGTLWRGSFRGVSTGEVYLGEVAFRLRPSALFLGALSADISVQDGAALGGARANLHIISQRISLANGNFAFDLSAVRRYSLFGIPYQGRIEVRDANIAWTREGCARAQGDVWTDVLDASSKALVGENLLLAGRADCENGSMLVALKGGNKHGKTEIKIAIDPSMTYRVMASVDLGRSDLENNLRQLGFEDDDGVLVFDVVGALKGAGS